MKRKKSKQIVKTMHQLLQSQPAEDINKGDLKALLAQYIIETPEFDMLCPITAQFNRHKLDAMRLLFDILNSDDQLNADDEWREMLAAGTPKQANLLDDTPKIELTLDKHDK